MMKTNYVMPQIEVIEIELEGILCGTNTGSNVGNENIGGNGGLGGFGDDSFNGGYR